MAIPSTIPEKEVATDEKHAALVPNDTNADIPKFAVSGSDRRLAVKRATTSELNDRCKDKHGSSDDVHTSDDSGGNTKRHLHEEQQVNG